eukprot:492712_1
MAMRFRCQSINTFKSYNMNQFHHDHITISQSFFHTSSSSMHIKNNTFSGNFTRNKISTITLSKKRFGLIAMKAWIKRQEKRKREQRTLEEASEKAQIELYKQWQPNETLNNEPVNIPNISHLYNTNQIEHAIQSIDNETENDIESHPYFIYSMLIIERLPIIARVYKYEEAYKSVLREAKLSQDMPKYFRELYIDHIKRIDSEKQKNEKIRPRITEHDLANEYHSLNRCLDLRLYLLTKIKNKNYWEFPWSIRQYNETLFETGHRSLIQRVGEYLHYTTITHEPFGHKEYQYDEKQQIEYGKKGGQLFFQKGYYVSGNGRPDISDIVEDFGWFTKQQLLEKVNPVLWDSLEPLLLE